MRRRVTVTTSVRCLCAVMVGCALCVSPGQAETSRFLQPPASDPGNPFDAALRSSDPPQQYGSYRYLGPGGELTTRAHVIFADEESAGDETSLPGEWNPASGPAGIEQTQYPLDEPPAREAPDEPGMIASRLPHPTAEPQPWITFGEVSSDATSVLGSGDGLGITTIVVRGVVESSHLKGFSIRPIFGLHAIGGPLTTDLPGQLYDVSIEARMYWPFGDRWLGEFAVAPGIFSDFENTSSDSIRIVGRGLGYYKWSDTLRLAIGLAYLDRQDIALLPLGGVIWTPNPDWRFEIMLPRPRIAHRYWSDCDHERWAYLLGEFGGGSWAIQRASGIDDIATYRDYRIILGLEFDYESDATWFLEGGYAFGRQLEYQSTVGNYEPDATALVRAGFSF